MKFISKLLVVLICFMAFGFVGLAQSNPYGKYQDLYGVKTIRCTWFAWQEAYDKAGVALPGWGNAQTWYNSAALAGYAVGREPQANSIAVYSSSDNYGHVAYVVAVDADGLYMTVNEAGIPTEENEGVVLGSRPSTTAPNLIGFIYLNNVPTNNNNNISNNNTTNNKSSNNNLSSLSIDALNFTFDANTYEYNLEVSYNTKIITIKATAEDTTAIITGAGEKALMPGLNTYKILVTAEDGSTKEYQINIIREDKEEVVEETLEVEKENNYIYLIIGIGILIGILGVIILRK